MDSDDSFGLVDRREMTATNLRQEGSIGLGPSHLASFGYEGRRFQSSIDYGNTLGFSDVIRDPRFVQSRSSVTEVLVDADSNYFSAWVSDRHRIGERLTLEAGARFDRQSTEAAAAASRKAASDEQISPRLNAVLDLGSAGLLRAGWGHFYQSQRPNELEVEFGSFDLYEAEKQEQLTLGWSRRWSSGLHFRADAYLRRSDNPRPRFETLFSQNSAFGELREDIYFADPQSFEAKGLELFLEGRIGRKLEGSAGYTYSKTEETFADPHGSFTRPRYNDQPHAVNLQLVYRPSAKWAFNAVWYYHTGWPTTSVEAAVQLRPGRETSDLDLVDLDFSIGPFYGERLPAYHRLDVRVTRSVETRRGSLSLYLDIQDFYDRDNVAGVDLSEPEFVGGEDDRYQVMFPVEEQLGLLPSFGVTWSF